MPFHRRAQPAEAVSAPAAPPTHFVELRDVCKYYQMGTVRISAADHINFYIEKGEFCVIVGPSGAGKTTVLNMLGGMDTCDEGEIWLDGQLVSRYSPKELTAYRRYDVGFVFQFYNLVQNLTALENVELASEICKEPLDAAETLEDAICQVFGHRGKSRNFMNRSWIQTVLRLWRKKLQILLEKLLLNYLTLLKKPLLQERKSIQSR